MMLTSGIVMLNLLPGVVHQNDSNQMRPIPSIIGWSVLPCNPAVLLLCNQVLGVEE